MTNRMHKSRSSRVLAGVCGGLGEYFAVDPTLVRLLFVLLAFINGIGILAYIILWVVMPEEKSADLPPRDAMRENISRMREDVQTFGGQFRGSATRPAATDPTRSEAFADTETASAAGTAESSFETAQNLGAGDDVETGRTVEPYRPSDPVPPVMDRATAANRQMVAGVLLLIVGGLVLLDNLNIFWWFSWGRMWPLILVAIGAWLLYDRSRARTKL